MRSAHPARSGVSSASCLLTRLITRSAVIQSAVVSNTLVSLPTGMGKTFVAAVVMLNYLRWFPEKIVVFLAPTKPLAKQQVDAVYGVVGIPPEMTTLMTGDLAPELRKARWQVRNCSEGEGGC